MMSIDAVIRWVRWQAPYAAFCCAYYPVTMAKRVVLTDKRAYSGLDPLGRRMRDRWGELPKPLRDVAATASPVWINMNSGGETVMNLPMLQALGVPQGPFILSTESYDTFALLCRTYDRDRIFFPPWDIQWPVRRALDQLRPRALVFVQTAYCPVLLREARRAGVKTVLVNGLLSRNVAQGNARMHRALALGFFRDLDAIAAQTEEDGAAFQALGVPRERLTITGNLSTDFSGVLLTAAERLRLRGELGLRQTDPVLIVGSTHSSEQQVMLEAFIALRRRLPDIRFIVVPRWVHEAKAIAAWFGERGFRVAMRTAFTAGRANGSHEYDVLIVDVFGELRSLYGVADVAYIGASLVPINEGRGGHNPLEPLAHGVVPLFGPSMNLWHGVVRELREAWPALEVRSAQQLAERAVDVLTGRAPLNAVQEVRVRLLGQSGSAVRRTAEFLRQQLGLPQ